MITDHISSSTRGKSGRAPKLSPSAVRQAVIEQQRSRRTVGRPSTMPADVPERVFNICAEFGPENQTAIAKALGVPLQRLQSWMKAHAALRLAASSGMDSFRSVKVEGSLLRKALGYEYTEVQERETTVMGSNSLGMKVQVPAMQRTETTKHVQPDTGAIIFYLTNRMPERWRQTFRTETRTDITTTQNQNVTVDLGNLETKDLEILRDILQRARRADEPRPAIASRGHLVGATRSRIAEAIPA